MHVREKKHRLPRSFYLGEVSVAFTLCIKSRARIFIDDQTVSVFTGILSSVAAKASCIVPAYCFMPDHQHMIVTGTSGTSDLWTAIARYKQQTGYWMSKNRPDVEWQKDFYDHVIKEREQISTHVKYILDNPVRKGLAKSWEEYPYKGAIGCSLNDILFGIT